MLSSWTQNYYHAVWGTKRRHGWIGEEVEQRIHAFLGGVARDLKCTVVAVNGRAEHVHMLVRFPSDLAMSGMVRHLKSRSSKWIHESVAGMRDFDWQDGYGGFTVSKSQVATVEAYIHRQKDHHRCQTFKEEYLAILRKTGWEGSDEDAFQ